MTPAALAPGAEQVKASQKRGTSPQQRSPAAPAYRRDQPPPPAAQSSDSSKDKSVSAARMADLGHVEKVRSELLLLILHVPSKLLPQLVIHPFT